MAVAVDADSAYRATLGTSRRQLTQFGSTLVPDFTRGMAADLEFRELSARDLRAGECVDFLPSRNDVAEFFGTRKVVEREDDRGRIYASVTSNVVDAMSRQAQDRETDRAARVGVKAKTFDLVALLTDSSLVEKFSIKGSLRAEVRNLAAVDTARASARLQAHVRGFDGYDRAVVSPGAYAGSWKAARASLRFQAARFPSCSVATEATFIGTKIFIYGPNGEKGWRVFGPESVASLVRMVHRMVAATSCESVVFLMGPELTLLDIDICDGDQVLCPVRERHAGPHDDMPLQDVARAAPSLEMAVRRKIEEVGKSCLTLAVDGVDSATAVRVSASHVLVNSHVVAGVSALSVGEHTVVPLKMLSRDLWVARLEGADTAWGIREPTVGELAVLCYRRHEVLQVSEPVRMLSVGGEVLTMTRDKCMGPGVSGAALVALADFSLLGVYDGVSLNSGLAAAFSSSMYHAVCAMDEEDAASRASAKEDGDGVFADMKQRGFGAMLRAAVAAQRPVTSDGMHVGMAFSDGGTWFTTCDPDVFTLSVGGEGGPLVFERAGRAMYRATGLPAVSRPVPAVVRAPAYGEKVFALGQDEQGVYCSKSTGRIAHVGVASEVFSVSGLPDREGFSYAGGLIVAHADAAVVGVYGQAIIDRKGCGVVQCFSYPRKEVPVAAAETPEAALTRVFPFLRPGTWPEGAALSVLSHGSAGMRVARSQLAYATIGDNAMRGILWEQLMAAGVPTAQWQTWYQRLQSNTVQIEVAAALDLPSIVRLGSGTTIPAKSKSWADLMEAIAGAVHLYESAENFETFCEAVKAVRSSYDG